MAEKEKQQYGVINEVGDLGLGFYEVGQEENEVITESKKHHKED